jgi:hypothetical protein
LCKRFAATTQKKWVELYSSVLYRLAEAQLPRLFCPAGFGGMSIAAQGSHCPSEAVPVIFIYKFIENHRLMEHRGMSKFKLPFQLVQLVTGLFNALFDTF